MLVLTIENPILSRFRKAALFFLEELLNSTCHTTPFAQSNETL